MFGCNYERNKEHIATYAPQCINIQIYKPTEIGTFKQKKI